MNVPEQWTMSTKEILYIILVSNYSLPASFLVYDFKYNMTTYIASH